nr:hypothetical protein BaRGS_031014 [Batillaria attramentaria]
MAAEANEWSGDLGHTARKLTAEEIERLKKDTALVSAFKQTKLEKEAEKNWDLFYKRNTTKFFKDRHWTKREFEELIGSEKDGSSRRVILEVGCGVGNFMFPLLEEDENNSLYFYACDFSKRAIQFVKEHPCYDSSRCTAFHADVTVGLTSTVPANSVDITTMIFVLSAIHPDKMLQALRSVLEVLKPGGVLLFRDYGLYDYAMLRFAPGHKLSENLYVRQDGTRAYYFSLEVLQELAEKTGFIVLSNQYVQRETVNKKEGLCVPRIFVQAKFAKPAPVLADAVPQKPFITDASTEGLGAVLYQHQDGRDRVIAYASRGLNEAERRYPAHKLELLALKWAVTDKFHDYL